MCVIKCSIYLFYQFYSLSWDWIVFSVLFTLLYSAKSPAKCPSQVESQDLKNVIFTPIHYQIWNSWQKKFFLNLIWHYLELMVKIALKSMTYLDQRPLEGIDYFWMWCLPIHLSALTFFVYVWKRRDFESQKTPFFSKNLHI